MKLYLLPAFVFVVLCQAILAGEERLEESPYYPLKVGTTWHYKLGDTPLIVRIAKHEKIGDVLCARVETETNGKVHNYEHVGLTKEGLVRYSFNGAKIEPPVVILKLPPKDGDSWTVSSKVGTTDLKAAYKTKIEKIEVPAGKFEVVSITLEYIDRALNRVTIVHSYAKNFGPVKQVSHSNELIMVLDLQKFEAGK